jgi:hypothetical protein
LIACGAAKLPDQHLVVDPPRGSADTQQYARATSLLLAAFAHYRSVCPLVSAETVDLLNT